MVLDDNTGHSYYDATPLNYSRANLNKNNDNHSKYILNIINYILMLSDDIVLLK